MKIPVEVSARHIHLKEEDFKRLFGKRKTLTEVKNLSQPEEFLAKEKLIIKGKSKTIENVGIIGPFRDSSQVEISLTDAYNLKIKDFPDITISGSFTTKKILVKGPNASLKLPCIISQRHLHCSVKEAKKLKLKNKKDISIKVKGKRAITFHNVLVRVSEKYKLSFHLDTDEGNSAGIFKKTFGEIVNEKK